MSCLVHHDGAEVHGSGWSEWTGAENPPTERNPPLHPGSETPGGGLQVSIQGTFGPRFRFRETIVTPGETVFAIGECRAAEALSLAEGEDPEDLDVFTEEVTASWIMDKPKSRPFVISTRPPESIAAEAELAATAAVPFALGLAAVAIVMLWVRYGG